VLAATKTLLHYRLTRISERLHLPTEKKKKKKKKMQLFNPRSLEFLRKKFIIFFFFNAYEWFVNQLEGKFKGRAYFSFQANSLKKRIKFKTVPNCLIPVEEKFGNSETPFPKERKTGWSLVMIGSCLIFAVDFKAPRSGV
jgi:hypothetical protein